MHVVNPRTLPEELIRIAAYYHSICHRPFTLAGFVRDNLPGRFDETGRDQRTNVEGEYLAQKQLIRVYLARIERNDPAIPALPPMLGEWLAVLTVLLHEIGHHFQLDYPDFRDDYNERGYADSWPEHDARLFVHREINRLATLDDDLFMPRHSKDMGWLGTRVSKELRALSREVWHGEGRWKAASTLRQARLRAIHVPARVYVGEKIVPVSTEKAEKLMTQFNASVYQNEKGEYIASLPITRANPDFAFADACGFTWSDRRGRRWRYVRLGQAVRGGLLDKLLRVDPHWV